MHLKSERIVGDERTPGRLDTKALDEGRILSVTAELIRKPLLCLYGSLFPDGRRSQQILSLFIEVPRELRDGGIV